MRLQDAPITITINDRTTTLADASPARPSLLLRVVCWLGRAVWRVLVF